MQRHKKLSARILSMALSVAMVTTMMPATVFAAEGDVPLGASSLGAGSIGTIQSFEKLEDRFEPSTGEGASKDVYALNVELNTPFEDLNLPDELTAMVARTTTVSAPSEDEPVVDSGKPSEPAEDEVIPDDTVSGNQPASPSDAEEEVKEEIKDEETTVTTTEQEIIPVTWSSDKEYKSDANGTFIYTAVLPEGYILADGVKLPQIYVLVGGQARDVRADVITVTINGSTTASGATLEAAIGTSSVAANAVTSLKITAGEVTTDDWKYLKNLTALTTFEIDEAVTDVADIPEAIGGKLFQTSIVTVTVPQAIAISSQVFYGCTALTTVSFPAATSIGDHAFRDCTILTNASFPGATSIGNAAFMGCVKFATLKLSATPPTVGANAFLNCPATRALGYVDADGKDLTGTALTNAQEAYKAKDDGDTADNLWYGWTIVSAAASDEQFNLPLGGTYYFDLSGVAGTITSGVSDKMGTINTSLPDATMHYVPFTYVGTVNAYSLDSSSSGQTSASAAATASDRSLFVADYNVSTTISWNSLNTNGLVFGNTFDTNYRLRSLSVGSSEVGSQGSPSTNEWDTILDKTAVTNPIKNWTGIYSWGQDTCSDNTATRALRGSKPNTRYYNYDTSLMDYKNYGFRPVLEVLSPDVLNVDSLNAVELDWNGGKFNNSTSSIKIVCAGGTFIAPGSTGLTAPTDKTAKATFWNTAADGSGTSYAAGASVPNTVTKLYAQWEDSGSTNSTITPTTATFDKYTSAAGYVDVVVTQTLNGNTLTAIKNGSATLTSSTDYTVSGNTITIKKEYLAQQTVGTTTLTFDYSAGTDPTMAITVSDSTPSGADKTALTTAIVNANNLKGTVIVSDSSASSVTSGTKFVTTAEMKALTDAIAAAQVVANNSAATEAEITAAVTALSTAVDNFKTAIKTGTYSGGGGGGGSSSGGGSTPTPPSAKPTEPVKGESNTTATVDDKGNATTTVTDKNIADAVKAAKDAASKKGVNAGEVTAVINVTSPANSNPNTVTVNLLKTVQQQVINGKIGNVAVVIDKPDIAISMNLATITEMNKQANADIQLSATRTDAAKISEEAKNAIGNRPAFDLKATYNSGAKSITNFGSGSVSVAIPYNLQAGEVAGGLYAVYIDGNGMANYITGSSYDANTKMLRFTTNHFSVYGIGYKAPTNFTDIAGHQAQTDIEFVVGRGLMSGIDNTTFSPNSAMTRGSFVAALGILAGVDTNSYMTSKFTDVKSDVYYAPYVNWAAEKGIASGTTATTFSPDHTVTRQEMAVFMSNYAKAIGYKVPETREAVIFADNRSIGSFAAVAVKQMQMGGVLNGKNGNLFDPTGAATRAEAASVLHRYVELAIDRSTAQGLDVNDSGSVMMYENGKMVKSARRTVGSITYNFNTNGEGTLLPADNVGQVLKAPQK